ncbi:MAG: radical SAM (seleno)protein TrsS [Oliverpabstia sp.]
MEFYCKKVENCFADARTYEYELPVTGEELISMLVGYEIHENHRFRRPVFSAKKGELEVKGILASHVVKVNYTAGNWEEEKKEMEQWMRDTELREIGKTESVCPECLKVISAKKVVRRDGIYLVKECPEHGRFEALIWEGDVKGYEAWGNRIQPADRISQAKPADQGCPCDCGLCESHERRGCCVLLEVTSRCNMHCPVCFAGAGEQKGEDVSLEKLKQQMEYLMSHGGPFNLQLSGGEPTVREDLEDIICLGRQKGFTFIQLNTNGIRLAKEPDYAMKLKKAGLSCVFLQFDGLKEEVYEILRGRKLLEIKKAAIDACEQAGLGVILVPVIAPGVNEDQVGEILAYAKSRMPAVRGVHFQPISYFGRFPEKPGSYRITIPKMLSLMEEQTGGVVRGKHFTGGNATNPYCTFQANYLRQNDGSMKPLLHGAARATATSKQAQEFVSRQWSGVKNNCSCEETEEAGCCRKETESVEKSCCCGESTSQMQLDTSALDEFLENVHNNTFAVSGMLFQDAYNLDLERLRRCYILETDSRYGMVPFCAYNLTGSGGKTLYR